MLHPAVSSCPASAAVDAGCWVFIVVVDAVVVVVAMVFFFLSLFLSLHHDFFFSQQELTFLVMTDKGIELDCLTIVQFSWVKSS